MSARATADGTTLANITVDHEHPHKGESPVTSLSVTGTNGRSPEANAGDVHRDICISVRGVTKTFYDRDGSEVTPLKATSLDVADGEFLCIVGESGCGKTTLLNIVSGLLAPTSGEVNVLGGSPMEHKAQMGFMFARDGLFPWRTASRNVAVGLEILGAPKQQRAARVQACLDLVGLGKVGHRYPWQLSQGMRQRVAIARTLATEPSVLLMDEPFAAVDAQTREMLQSAFLDIWEHHRKTVVFVTHDLSEAILLGDRIVLMQGGHVAYDVRVPFDRPRSLDDLRGSSEYLELYQELHRRLRQ
jgi:NitT/TauT family transport system ATP-binding protein